MPINWEEFQATIDAEMDAAATATSANLASQASSITRLTDDEMIELFPSPAEMQKLKNLMEIVKSTDDENEKINRLVTNIEILGGTTLKLLNTLA